MQEIGTQRFEQEMRMFEGFCNKAVASMDEIIETTTDLRLKDELIEKKANFEKFIEFVTTKTDFISAPCSTKYHLCIPHGLLIHSNSVTKTAIKLNNALNAEIPLYRIIITCMFHDLGKHDDYEPNTGNNKYYVPYNFSQLSYSEHEDQSAYLLMKYNLLNEEDFVAIVSHNSPWDGNVKCAFKQNKMMTILQNADYWSTLYLEDRPE